MLTLKKRKNVEIGLDQITGLILAFFIGNTSSLTDIGQEYKWCPAGNIMGSTWCGITCITKAVSWWQVSRTSVQLGEPNGNDGTWTMTGTKCAAIKRLISIMRSGDKTEFINRLKTPDLFNRNGRIFSRRDQIQMPMDEVPTEKVASQQQTLAVAEGPLQDMTVTCKQCEVTFVFTKGEQRFFQGKNMTQPARCPECRKWIRSSPLGHDWESLVSAGVPSLLLTDDIRQMQILSHGNAASSGLDRRRLDRIVCARRVRHNKRSRHRHQKNTLAIQ